MAMTTDADIPLLCGDCCIAIKGFTGKSYELVCVSESRLKSAMKYLPRDSKAKFTVAKHPIFDGVQNPRLRALLLVILGCDVYSGIVGVQAASLNTIIKNFNAKSEDELYVKLRGKLKYTKKLTDELIDTYIGALIYEPTNPVALEDQTTPIHRSYLFGPPDSLPEYLKEFAVDDDFVRQNIFAGPAIAKCKGVGERSHLFLQVEGAKICFKCSETVCQSCHGDVAGQAHCLSCLAGESVVPKTGTSDSKTIAEMRKELMADKFDGAKDLTVDEVEDVYEMMQHLKAYRQTGETVPYPIYKTSTMETSSRDAWQDITEIDFKGGGAFLAESALEQKYIPRTLKLFAELVKFENGKKTEWKKDHSIYEALPSMFIRFANNSRIDSGFRLLMRCVQHAFDIKHQIWIEIQPC